MIAVIRIRGMVDVPRDIAESLNRIRLRRKYAAVVLKDSPENRKLLKKIRNYVSYGKITPATFEKLLKNRGVSIGKTDIDVKKIISEFGNKNMEELGIKPFFRLHPPRGGIESKKHSGVGKGVLGENKDIDKLLERMLWWKILKICGNANAER